MRVYTVGRVLQRLCLVLRLDAAYSLGVVRAGNADRFTLVFARLVSTLKILCIRARLIVARRISLLVHLLYLGDC